ncbi:hypothetical protein PO002_33620 [Cupriavidus necator]|uniref:hypothetical protein n=1 Tax=Cupriavidus necator TaxID=106590 RepID=UPI0039C3A238
MRINPLACDTQDGIATWWLSPVVVPERDLAIALAWLERAGVIASFEAADGRVHYRRAALDARVDALLDQLIRGETMP